ncbi:type II secretion system F family protein [Thermoactinospora rubra]|uniref:type II secretion system F family protein n=1 Tax=Thermoactinospora rubra TaxID=1088767 RepID=UPI000A119AAD|nr:type II secretion system F family protein [Thermoactinospora rubra]
MTAILSGCLIGLGLAVLVAHLFPAPPRLDAAIARLEGTEAEVTGLGSWLALRLPRVPVPCSDLELLGMSVEQFMLKRVGYGIFGLVLPSLLYLAYVAVGLSLPWMVPLGAGLVLCVLFALIPDLAVRNQARERRQEFRAALSTYLDMVALERAAGAGPTQALQAPADVCTGWVFRRIAEVLQQARHAGEQPWRGLAELGERAGVTELTELADIAEDAGSEGTQVLSTLLAKAQSMRTAALADARAKANSRTSEMPVAIGLSVFGFLVLVCFPAVYRIMS